MPCRVQELTLRKGLFTAHRREAPIQQVYCMDGCDKMTYPDVVTCRNGMCLYFPGIGSYSILTAKAYAGHVDWRCEADLPIGAQLLDITVQCEGFDYDGDPYILTDSCGVSFSIFRNKYHYVDSAALPSSGQETQLWRKLTMQILAAAIVLLLTIFYCNGYHVSISQETSIQRRLH